MDEDENCIKYGDKGVMVKNNGISIGRNCKVWSELSPNSMALIYYNFFDEIFRTFVDTTIATKNAKQLPEISYIPFISQIRATKHPFNVHHIISSIKSNRQRLSFRLWRCRFLFFQICYGLDTKKIKRWAHMNNSSSINPNLPCNHWAHTIKCGIVRKRIPCLDQSGVLHGERCHIPSHLWIKKKNLLSHVAPPDLFKKGFLFGPNRESGPLL